MRSGLVAVLVLFGACGFSVSGGAAGDGGAADARDDDGPVIDGAADGPGLDTPTTTCAGRKRWRADFSQDPRTVDFDGDQTNDWALRQTADSVPLPGTLAGGVWAVSALASPPLDTRPLDGWNGVTTAKIRMRATNNTPVDIDNGAWGVVFWLNSGYDGGDFAPVIVGITRQDNQQFVQLYTRPDNNSRVAQGAPVTVGSGMVDIDLTVDMTQNLIRMEVASSVRTANPTQFAQGGSNDKFATLYAWNNAAEFDTIELTNCP